MHTHTIYVIVLKEHISKSLPSSLPPFQSIFFFLKYPYSFSFSSYSSAFSICICIIWAPTGVRDQEGCPLLPTFFTLYSDDISDCIDRLDGSGASLSIEVNSNSSTGRSHCLDLKLI